MNGIRGQKIQKLDKISIEKKMDIHILLTDTNLLGKKKWTKLDKLDNLDKLEKKLDKDWTKDQ